MFLEKLLNFILSLFRSATSTPSGLKSGKLALSNYPIPPIDYGTLNLDQEIAMRSIITAGPSEQTVHIPEMTQEQFDAVVTHIGMHFGNQDLCKNIALKRGNTAVIDLDIYRQSVTNKAELDRKVTDALATLNEGTIESKLEQAAKYIANNVKYKNGTNNPLDLLNDGGMCGAYSMLFYKMATRLGADAYICYGYASNGVYSGAHAWNMIKIAGKEYFYDITFYDSGRLKKYLHDSTGWNRTYRLNDQSGMRKS